MANDARQKTNGRHRPQDESRPAGKAGADGSIQPYSQLSRRQQVRTLLTNPTLMRIVQDAIPPGIQLSPARLAWTAITVCDQPNDRGELPLYDCSDLSLCRALVQAAELGLEFGSHLGHCYLIPYSSEATFQMGVWGYVTLAQRSGQVARIWSEVIYEADQYLIRKGEDPLLEHNTTRSEFLPGRNLPIGFQERDVHPIEDGGAGRALGTYACAELVAEPSSAAVAGRFKVVSWDLVTEADCVMARGVSRAQNSPAYTKWPDEMRKRTAIKRARKKWPVDPLFAMAQAIDDGGRGSVELEQRVMEVTGTGEDVPRQAAPAAQPAAKPQGALDAMVNEHKAQGGDAPPAELPEAQPHAVELAGMTEAEREKLGATATQPEAPPKK